MIIVSQDKEEIVNFDITHHIWIENDSEKFEIYADGELLGYYKTKERAKEVLRQIIGKYLQYFENRNREMVMIPKVYEMPKE